MQTDNSVDTGTDNCPKTVKPKCVELSELKIKEGDDISSEEAGSTKDANLITQDVALGYEHSPGLVHVKQNLHELKLSFENLNSIPKAVFQMKSLSILNLSSNSLKVVPDDIRHLKGLICLDLSFNKLENLPISFSDIHLLRCLNISHNNFTTVPAVLYSSLPFIRILDISFNLIENFNEQPCCVISLEELNLSHNKLNVIPQWIFDIKCKIKNLDLNNNSLKDLGKNFLHESVLVKLIENLNVLNLQNCKLTCETLNFTSNMIGLETLNLSNSIDVKKDHVNYVENLDEEIISKWTNLKYFYASNINLSRLTDNFGCLYNIQYIDLSRNFLTWLPDSFCNLISLVVCKLNSNLLYFLPSNFGKLINLKKIFLSENNLTGLPESVKLLVNLEYLDLYNNKLENIDAKIIELKSLKGIDLENNFLNCNSLCTEVNRDEFYDRYSTLRESYRKELKLERINLQKIKICKSETPTSNSNDSPDDNYDFSLCNVLGEAEFLCVEKWDEECSTQAQVETNDNDDFDPNVNYESELKLKKNNRKNLFAGNFCPGDSHVPSLKNYFTRQPDNGSVDGQYELN